MQHHFTVILGVLFFSASSFCFASDQAHAAKASSSSRYAAIMVDAHSGKILFSRKADALRYPASLTKMMTLYLLFEALDKGHIHYNTQLIVSKKASRQPPSKLGLKAGKTIRVRHAIRALIAKSANDVAIVVAERLGGSEQRFARMMTKKASQFGMRKTRFRNASGLPDSGHVSTARDLVTLSIRLIKDFPNRSYFFKTRYFSYHGKRYRNYNSLLFNYKGTTGLKTGYTRASGYNLSASVKRGNKHLIGVVLGGKTAKSRDAHMRKILSKSFRKASSYIARKKPKVPARVKKASASKKSLQSPLPERNPQAGQRLPDDGDFLPQSKQALTKVKAHPDPVKRLNRAKLSSDRTAYQVQVGAFSSTREAENRLNFVRAKADDLLSQNPSMTMPLKNGTKQFVRARFAAFSKQKARKTCKQLKRRSIDCLVMRAE